MTDSLEKFLEENGYMELKLNNAGYCGLRMFIFTTGLLVGLDYYGYKGRYCYHTLEEAREALESWDGVGDPPGNWIKYKGDNEKLNPNYIKP